LLVEKVRRTVRWQGPIGWRSFWMEVEVNALMGADDEAIWNRAGLFASVDEMSVGACGKLKKVSNAELISEPSSATRGEPCITYPETLPPFPGGSYPHQKFLQCTLWVDRTLQGG
jgi:hypothetical protein